MVRALILVLLSGAAYGQSAPAPRFEVASVKPSMAGPGRSTGVATGHGRVTVGNETLKRCIMGAFNVGPHQIAGGPAWLDSDRFEIAAKSERAEDNDEVLMAMLRTLLAERFQLVVHRETRTVQALVLEVAKNGPKLEKAADGPATTENGRGLIDAKVITMNRFAQVLSRQMELPVVDRTGLEGSFNLKLEWAPETVKPDAMESRPSIFSAVQQQLGLRLESRKVAMEILVIDHAEKPSEN
ncbi:MAG: TIGR03435 family protein [Bryobacteraceae bacterium]|jgi:uncharacterized protein (TIGR03435 family)